MLINAFRRANSSQLDTLNRWIGASEINPTEKIAAVTRIYDELKLKELSEEKIETYFDEAMLHLEALSVEKEKLAALKEVSRKLMHRKS